jgi:hypothetical protein
MRWNRYVLSDERNSTLFGMSCASPVKALKSYPDKAAPGAAAGD